MLDLCTSPWASVWGEVRPRLGSCPNGIAAVGAPMSAIPDVSRFWTATTSNDTCLLTDEAHFRDEMPRVKDDGALTYEMGYGWSGGRITWPIPMGWQSRDACETDLPELKRMANLYQQVFRITAEGTASVEKHGYKASRGTNDVVWLERGTEE